MKCALLTSKGFVFDEMQVPTCGANQVLVKTAGCGVCEGDLFQYICRTSDPNCDQSFIAVGHEASGVVEAVGSAVSEFKPGDRVTALTGKEYAEYFVAEKENLALIPSGIPTAAALGEPLGCCLHAAGRFGVRLGDRVGVIGCGYMGLLLQQLAALSGAAEVVTFDLIPWRLEMSKNLGANKVVNVDGKSPEQCLAELGEFDVMIEATGVEAAITLSTKLVKEHGVINLIGYHQSGGGLRSIDVKTWNYKAISVINGHVRRADEKLAAMKAGLALVASGRLKMAPLVTDYAFADINKAFADLKARKSGLYKANLVF